MDEIETKAERLIWHHQAHEEWGKERLFFWRLAFHPTYNRKKVVNRIEAFLKENGACSYAFYELTGLRDLLVRFWLPTSTKPAIFAEDIRRELQPAMSELFPVAEVIAHWVWNPDLRLADSVLRV